MATATGQKDSLLFVWDRHTGCHFLTNTGAEASVLPATGLDIRTQSAIRADNCSTIRTYGVHTIEVCLASKNYKWNFIVANVSWPLLGTDFLHANSLLVDLKGKHLNTETYLSTPLQYPRREHHIWTPSQYPQTHILNCSLSSQKSRFLTSPKHLKSTKWSTTSPSKALQCMDMHVASPQTSCRQPRENSNEWASYSVHLVNGHHCFTWYLRLQEVGDLAVTTGA